MAIPSRSDDNDPRVPALSIVLGYGPMLPIVFAAIGVWLLPPPWPIVATALALLWSASILIFLAGVRRGLSFRTPGGARPVQLVTMIWYFLLGVGAFAVSNVSTSLVLLILGYVSVAILDPIAARRQEVPAHFARLRPLQMGLGVLALLAILIWHLTVLRALHPAMA
jgi:hypothetical protein